MQQNCGLHICWQQHPLRSLLMQRTLSVLKFRQVEEKELLIDGALKSDAVLEMEGGSCSRCQAWAYFECLSKLGAGWSIMMGCDVMASMLCSYANWGGEKLWPIRGRRLTQFWSLWVCSESSSEVRRLLENGRRSSDGSTAGIMICSP
ncbi:hypothetical protein VNO80_26021 [Phaseolus coccineus]|uniref:Uncharacterized protein n=1 Tax=Phaseolus coccineus TaxID=3886 RepID=A0AAN9LYW0_PHACN